MRASASVILASLAIFTQAVAGRSVQTPQQLDKRSPWKGYGPGNLGHDHDHDHNTIIQKDSNPDECKRSPECPACASLASKCCQ
ncbi:hypothetical protein XA68_15330 [Ophiocordyceps unilateralis]|uniref:Secreted protein n=1 Tax=Ophiocordyceps unilateralis TaxID=268505 RepID=A0A2A9P8M0_OPHUN|nr:hypothetical protein XA68_15330 [Ophiocordyceps unilateralis]